MALLPALQLAAAVNAQEVRGVVRDSATRAPVAGVVFTVTDASGALHSRSMSGQDGGFRLAVTATARQVRAVRMGYRPRDFAVDASDAPIDVHMAALPTMLEPVRIVRAGANCPRRRDAEAALALREQTRAALLASIVGRQTRRAQMTRLLFQRRLGSRDEIESQRVRIDSSELTGSWSAGRPAREFVTRGFLLLDRDGNWYYYAPDASVLLEDDFADNYCYRLREPDASRPHQLGLAFGPARRQRGRVDVDGTLWVDTLARQLRSIEFKYIGLASWEESLEPGGRVTFSELPNGTLLIDRWFLRIPNLGADTTSKSGRRMSVRFATESGGEVASAVWDSLNTYQGTLGILNGRAVDSRGRPVTTGVVRLENTDYVTSPDASGFFEFTNLLPGPYDVKFLRDDLQGLGITIPTSMHFTAVRDSVVQRQLLVPAKGDFVRDRCTGTWGTREERPWLLARVTMGGRPVEGIRWEISKFISVERLTVTETRVTPSDGYIYSCLLMEEGDVVDVRVWNGDHELTRRVTLRRRPTELKIELSN